MTEHTLAADGSDTIPGYTDIIENDGYNHINDTPNISSDIRIRIRGNSSRHFDKKPYLIELINKSDGTNNPQPVMGMDSHHEWALHGPYLDKTLIRNYMWYNISGQIMDYAPNVRFCELILNGEYQGVYLMTETITAGEDARIPVSVDRKDNTYTGYILRHDRGSGNELKNINPLTIYTMRTDKKINIVYPSGSSLNEELARSIELNFSAFEKAIHSYDFDDEEGYKGNIDVESFVDYFIINEVTLNRDAGLYSTYIYKDVDRKYKMCVWDFNNALDNYEDVENSPYDSFAMYGTLWFNRLVQDKDFTHAIAKRYRELRKDILSDEYLTDFIDDTIEYLGPAIERNYEKWGYSFDESKGRLKPKERNPKSFEEALKQMRTCLITRLHWMDKNIDSINQYSAASKTHESHEAHEQ